MVVTLVLAAQYAGALDLVDTTSARVRSTSPAPVVSGRNEKVVLAADLATAATARVSVHDRFTDGALSLSPTFTTPDVELGFVPQLLGAATASVGWHDRFVRIGVSESASYGRLNSAFLYAPSVPQASVSVASTPTTQTSTGQGAMAGTGTTGSTAGGQTGTSGTASTGSAQTTRVTSNDYVDVGATATDASLAVRASRHVTVAVSGGYSVGGGLTATSQLTLPMQYGPRAAASVTDALSRTDSVTTSAGFLATTTYGACPDAPTSFCREHATLFQLQAALRHPFSATEVLTVTGGASVAVTRSPLVNEAVIEPIAVAALSIALSARALNALAVSLQLAPVVDARTGLPSERVQLGAALGTSLNERVLVLLSAGVLRSVPVVSDPYPITGLSGSVEARFQVTRRLDLGVGEQEFWQSQSPYGSITSSIAYVSFTARAATLHF